MMDDNKRASRAACFIGFGFISFWVIGFRILIFQGFSKYIVCKFDYRWKLGENEIGSPPEIRLGCVPIAVGLWRSWERASMAWKRSSVRTRPGPPIFQSLSRTRFSALGRKLGWKFEE